MSTFSPRVRLAIRGLAAGLALLCVAVLIENRIEAHWRARLSQGETFALIDGARIHYQLRGAERPGTPVVFLCGFVASVERWDRVVEALGPAAPTLTYDRAGLGLSEARSGTDGSSMLRELESILQASGVKRPVVLVSFSASGLLAEAFTKQHPEEVAGLVFLDTVPPEQQATAGTAEEQKRSRGVYKGMIKQTFRVGTGFERIYAWLRRHGEPPTRGDEVLLLASHWWTSLAEARANSQIAGAAMGFSPRHIPIAMLSTRASETSPDQKQMYALQHELAASSGWTIFRDLSGIDHVDLPVDPPGVQAAASIIREELAALASAK